MNIILDASMALSWIFLRSDESERACSAKALEAAASVSFVVPHLWITEVANALLVAERRNLLTAVQSGYFLEELNRLSVMQDPAKPAERISAMLTFARDHKLSSYDATYLELAKRTRAQLATFDRKLADAARACEVPVFGDVP